jgi:hypothetical protein
MLHLYDLHNSKMIRVTLCGICYSQEWDACIINTILCTLYFMNKQNVRHISSSVCCYSQNCTWLTFFRSIMFCNLLVIQTKAVILNTPFPCLCSTGHHECCAWASLPCILNAVFSNQWLPTFCIHSFIHNNCLNQYSMCITTFSLSLTLCCCSLKFFTVETTLKKYVEILLICKCRRYFEHNFCPTEHCHNSCDLW